MEEKILENITKSITERLKVPIILTYVCVLIIHNWDVLYYLFFEPLSASAKIQYIQKHHGNFYYARIVNSLIIAVTLIIIFTILNTSINFCLKWFYRKDKEINSEIESYEQINILTKQLSKSIEEIKSLKSQVENLKNINESLNLKNLTVDIGEISKKDYEIILTYITSQENKEKLLFSFKEFITTLKNDISTDREKLYRKATYYHDMEQLVKYLERNKFLKVEHRYNSKLQSYSYMIDLSKSLQDILKMEI